MIATLKGKKCWLNNINYGCPLSGKLWHNLVPHKTIHDLEDNIDSTCEGKVTYS